MILQHIIRLSCNSGPSVELNVCRYLSLSIATLALQRDKPGIVNDILIWLNPIVQSSPIVLLELLVVLPEEAFNRQVDSPSIVRDRFVEQLTVAAPEVLSFISTLWPKASTLERFVTFVLISELSSCPPF